jgi:hypothetical protein
MATLKRKREDAATALGRIKPDVLAAGVASRLERALPRARTSVVDALLPRLAALATLDKPLHGLGLAYDDVRKVDIPELGDGPLRGLEELEHARDVEAARASNPANARHALRALITAAKKSGRLDSSAANTLALKLDNFNHGALDDYHDKLQLLLATPAAHKVRNITELRKLRPAPLQAVDADIFVQRVFRSGQHHFTWGVLHARSKGFSLLLGRALPIILHLGLPGYLRAEHASGERLDPDTMDRFVDLLTKDEPDLVALMVQQYMEINLIITALRPASAAPVEVDDFDKLVRGWAYRDGSVSYFPNVLKAFEIDLDADVPRTWGTLFDPAAAYPNTTATERTVAGACAPLSIVSTLRPRIEGYILKEKNKRKNHRLKDFGLDFVMQPVRGGLNPAGFTLDQVEQMAAALRVGVTVIFGYRCVLRYVPPNPDGQLKPANVVLVASHGHLAPLAPSELKSWQHKYDLFYNAPPPSERCMNGKKTTEEDVEVAPAEDDDPGLVHLSDGMAKLQTLDCQTSRAVTYYVPGVAHNPDEALDVMMAGLRGAVERFAARPLAERKDKKKKAPDQIVVTYGDEGEEAKFLNELHGALYAAGIRPHISRLCFKNIAQLRLKDVVVRAGDDRVPVEVVFALANVSSSSPLPLPATGHEAEIAALRDELERILVNARTVSYPSPELRAALHAFNPGFLGGRCRPPPSSGGGMYKPAEDEHMCVDKNASHCSCLCALPYLARVGPWARPHPHTPDMAIRPDRMYFVRVLEPFCRLTNGGTSHDWDADPTLPHELTPMFGYTLPRYRAELEILAYVDLLPGTDVDARKAEALIRECYSGQGRAAGLDAAALKQAMVTLLGKLGRWQMEREFVTPCETVEEAHAMASQARRGNWVTRPKGVRAGFSEAEVYPLPAAAGPGAMVIDTECAELRENTRLIFYQILDMQRLEMHLNYHKAKDAGEDVDAQQTDGQMWRWPVDATTRERRRREDLPDYLRSIGVDVRPGLGGWKIIFSSPEEHLPDKRCFVSKVQARRIDLCTALRTVPCEMIFIPCETPDEVEAAMRDPRYCGRIFLTGSGGAGKTWVCLKTVLKDFAPEEVLIVVPQHMLATRHNDTLASWGARGVRIVTAHAFTGVGIELTAGKRSRPVDLTKVKVVVIDEAIAYSLEMWRLIAAVLLRNQHIRAVPLGDPGQMPPCGEATSNDDRLRYLLDMFPVHVKLLGNRRMLDPAEGAEMERYREDLASPRAVPFQVYRRKPWAQIIDAAQTNRVVEAALGRGVYPQLCSYFNESRDLGNALIHADLLARLAPNTTTYGVHLRVGAKAEQMRVWGSDDTGGLPGPAPLRCIVTDAGLKDAVTKERIATYTSAGDLNFYGVMRHAEFRFIGPAVDEDDVWELQDAYGCKIAVKGDVLGTHFSLGYGMTGHASQGGTVAVPLLVTDLRHPIVDRFWAYTVASRVQRLCDLYVMHDRAFDWESHMGRFFADAPSGYKDQDKQRFGSDVLLWPGYGEGKRYVDRDWLERAYQEQRGRCPGGCGEHLGFTRNHKHILTVQRIDNRLPHWQDNGCLMCLSCNTARARLVYDHLAESVRRAYSFFRLESTATPHLRGNAAGPRRVGARHG